MAKLRVFELARQLSLENKELIDKIKEMDIDVKSHLSSLDDETAEKIKAGLRHGSKEASKIEVKRIKPTVIRRRKKVVKPKAVKEKVEKAEEKEIPEEDKKVEDTEELKEAQKLEKKKPKKKSVKKKKTAKKVAKKKKAKEAAEEISEEKDVAEEVKKKPKKREPAKKEKKKAVKKKQKKKKTAAKIIKLPEIVEEEPETAAVSEEAAIPPEEAEKKEKKRFKKKKKKKKGESAKKEWEEYEEGHKTFKKKTSFRRKEIIEGKALYDEVRVRGRKSRKGAKKAAVFKGEKTQITMPKAIKRRVKIDDTIVLSDLAKRMGIKAGEIIQKLMGMGVMATVNQTIDFDTAVLVASEFEYELEKATFEETELLTAKEDEPDQVEERPPVVTIMGHVDHGKTSLLDVIRQTNVTDTEAGGITQHIGAYNVKTERGRIVFLDTPGHEAFTSMRSRGAQITDVVVLVVAADDGVMPQTIEAINHSKSAEVPIIVAINKIDKEESDTDRVKRELSEHGIVSEDWGGDTIFTEVSAKQNKGIENLLDMILLQAEILELKANPSKRATGHVVEARLDTGRGPVATVLVQQGTLKTGESAVCGIYYGKIRALINDRGIQVDSAGPSIPVEVLGLDGVPDAGDELIAVDDDKVAKQVSLHRGQKQRSKDLARSSRMSLEGLFEKMEEGEVKDLNVIIKADVHGSIEALKDSLNKLSGGEVKINIVHSATGTVHESDVSLAAVSEAIIIGFNVRPGAKVQDLADEENVDMRFYDVIYNVIKDIKDAMVGMMKSTFKEQILGRAEVREVFVIPKKGSIAGSYVLDGKVERGGLARLVRDGVVTYEGKVGSLRRFKDDAKEVMSGFECGIGIENYNDIKVGDVIECYNLEEIKPVLD